MHEELGVFGKLWAVAEESSQRARLEESGAPVFAVLPYSALAAADARALPFRGFLLHGIVDLVAWSDQEREGYNLPPVEVIADEANREASDVVAKGDVELVVKTTAEGQQEVVMNCCLDVDTCYLLMSISSSM